MVINCENSEYTEFLEKVFAAALDKLRQPSNIEIGVSFVGRDKIQELNKTMRSIDKATDVLSFPSISISAGDIINVKDYPFDTDPHSGLLCLGDIVICADVAEEQAKKYGHSATREVAYLSIHSLLHLLGYDHMRDADKLLMRTKEEEVLNAFDISR